MSSSKSHMLPRMVLDLVYLGLAGGALGLAMLQGELGISFMLGAWWVALNLAAMALLLGAISSQKKPSKLFIFGLVCAKIPASYLILWQLFAADYLNRIGLAVGVLSLPLVLVWRGLSWGEAEDRSRKED